MEYTLPVSIAGKRIVHIGISAAMQDKVDDVTAGVKSTALLFGDRTKLVLSGFAGASAGLLAIAGAFTRHLLRRTFVCFRRDCHTLASHLFEDQFSFCCTENFPAVHTKGPFMQARSSAAGRRITPAWPLRQRTWRGRSPRSTSMTAPTAWPNSYPTSGWGRWCSLVLWRTVCWQSPDLE